MSEQPQPVQLNSKTPKDCLIFFNENLRKNLSAEEKDGFFHEFRLEAAGTIAKLIEENEALKKELSILKETPKIG